MSLVEFCDSFDEFNDYGSFLCDAMSSLFCEYQDCEPNIHTILGAKRHCRWLKGRASVLKEELKEIDGCLSIDPNITKLKSTT